MRADRNQLQTGPLLHPSGAKVVGNQACSTETLRRVPLPSHGVRPKHTPCYTCSVAPKSSTEPDHAYKGPTGAYAEPGRQHTFVVCGMLYVAAWPTQAVPQSPATAVGCVSGRSHHHCTAVLQGQCSRHRATPHLTRDASETKTHAWAEHTHKPQVASTLVATTQQPDGFPVMTAAL